MVRGLSGWNNILGSASGYVWDAAPLHFNLSYPEYETWGLVEEGTWFFLWEDVLGLLELVFRRWEGSCCVSRSCHLATAELDGEGVGKSCGV